ncbi:hypothetical protein [Pedobacter sp.]|uniref:tetratricopeptide repeat protein n=1 Tax=Pedobacter sp. TaxID=1411316 RepID=UPI0031DFB614
MTPISLIKKQLVICLFFLLGFFQAFSQNKNGDTLLNNEGLKKLAALSNWYYRNVRQYDSVKAFKAFEDLQQRATKADDKVCLAAVVFYRGQYQAIKINQDSLGVNSMKRGIKMAELNRQTLQAAEFSHHLGYYYFIKGKYSTALSYMLKANYVFQHIGYGQIEEPGYLLYRLAFVYYHLRNYHEALKHLQTALKYPKNRPVVDIYILNTLGLSYRELYQPDSAKHYFLLAKAKAVATRDTAWMGIISGNIGNLHLKAHDYSGALPFFEHYYKYSLISKDKTCIAEALMGLADIAVFYKRYDEALKRLKDADDTYHTKPGNIQVEDYIKLGYLYNIFSRAWEGKGNAQQSLYYRKLADGVRDSIDRRVQLSNNVAIQQLLEAEQHSSEIKLLEKEKHTALLKQYFLVAATILLVIIFLLVYNRQSLKRKKDKAFLEKKEVILQAEKEKIEAELKHATEMLNSYVENLQQKTALLDQVQTEMQLLQQSVVDPDEELLFLQRLNDSTILTEEQWHEFRELFEKVHAGFFIKLKTTYPNLTPAETRLCALTKLQLGTKEIAAILGVNADTIKKTRQRLRKKIDITEDIALETVVNTL